MLKIFMALYHNFLFTFKRSQKKKKKIYRIHIHDFFPIFYLLSEIKKAIASKSVFFCRFSNNRKKRLKRSLHQNARSFEQMKLF